MATTNGGTLTIYFNTEDDRIRYVADMGFKYLDFSFYRNMTPDSILMGDHWEVEANRLADIIQECGLEVIQSHAPGVNPLDQSHQEENLAMILRTIECCNVMGIPTTVFHFGTDQNITKEEFLARNKEFVQRLIPQLERTGVQLLIENIGSPSDRYFLRNGEELKEAIEYIDHPLVNACWDTGHANAWEDDQYKSITALGSRLKGLHVEDNLGGFNLQTNAWTADLHTMPYFGSVNFDAVIQALLDINYEGYFTFEVDVPRLGFNRRDFTYNGKQVNRLKVAPLFVKQQTDQLMYQIGKYMLSQYGCFEE